MNPDNAHISAALKLTRQNIALAERRRPRDVAGPQPDKAAQIARLRAQEARLISLLKEQCQ